MCSRLPFSDEGDTIEALALTTNKRSIKVLAKQLNQKTAQTCNHNAKVLREWNGTYDVFSTSTVCRA